MSQQYNTIEEAIEELRAGNFPCGMQIWQQGI